MGFKDAKRDVLSALASGAYRHEERGDIDLKNLLATGVVSPERVIEVINKSRGHDHSSSPHHIVADIDVHVIRREGWYIKFYVLAPNVWFISVHQ